MQTVPGHVHEIFKSYQGEGPFVGRRQLFLRLGGCSLRCRYCDTPDALVRRAQFALEREPGMMERRENPVSAPALTELLDQCDPGRLELAVTGGEPLDQTEFLLELLPLVRRRRSVFLETAGVHAAAMARLQPLVDIVSMDLKLDSTAHEGDRLEEHRAFLAAARGSQVYAKVVVSDAVAADELDRAARVVAEQDPTLTLVLQPETQRATQRPAAMQRLDELFQIAARHVRDVRVIPQTHKYLGLP